MKTLNTIQTLSKIGKILSKIVYICCIVGFCGCVAGIIAMSVGSNVIKLGGMTLHGIIEAEAGIGLETVLAAITVGMILSIGEFYISRMAYRYFDNELKAGTPFTEDGAKELMHLGISVIWVPVLTMVLAQVAQVIFSQFSENIEDFNLDGFSSVALGVMLIVMSLLCKYGAELAKKESINEQE